MRREGSKLEVDFKERVEECDDVLDIELESVWMLVSEVGDVTMIVMGLLEACLWVLSRGGGCLVAYGEGFFRSLELSVLLQRLLCLIAIGSQSSDFLLDKLYQDFLLLDMLVFRDGPVGVLVPDIPIADPLAIFF